MERITMTIQRDLLKELEGITKELNKSRSEVIREALVDYVKKYNWLHRIESKAGDITLIYHPKVYKQILEIEKNYKDVVLVSFQSIVNDELLRVIVVKGSKERIIELTEKLKSLNDVKYAKLTTIGIPDINF
ncbi:CopG family ribbon-helix-helix protein [Methanotorris igneus]|uniref:Transcriptional regulator NikR, CopG family n=1 Tax=Methanotorris igneus (strain DSM 5666 / JCM 11834 / Kol 5) TaxID=880724 RepID=F6BBI8_METIK|nr:CopG family ribbon-helix-helix protein [Methanotorris igneus]AEF95997.1 transcriptional regulator NikR, CopG family [Methanotorris igneus Kol 5]